MLSFNRGLLCLAALLCANFHLGSNGDLNVSGSRAERASGRRLLLLLWIALDPLDSCLGVGSAEKRAG